MGCVGKPFLNGGLSSFFHPGHWRKCIKCILKLQRRRRRGSVLPGRAYTLVSAEE